jgi:cell division septum initiation protein DivIVA
MTTCKECDRLRGEVQDALARLTHLTTAQLNAFRSNDDATFMQLDKELESAVGTKERTIGAMRQHEREHRKSA